MSEDRRNDTGAAQPTGKRQLSGESTTQASSKETAKVSTKESGGKGNKVINFVPEVVSELRKVIWPTGREMVVYTLIVFAFLIVVTALVSGVDFLAGLGIDAVFGV